MFVTAFRCVSCKGVFTFINIFMVTLDTGFVFFLHFQPWIFLRQWNILPFFIKPFGMPKRNSGFKVNSTGESSRQSTSGTHRQSVCGEVRSDVYP